MQTNRETIQELVDIVFDLFSKNNNGNVIMLKPALNIAKIKLSQLDETDAANIVDQIHKISRLIEKKTGKLSPYHGID